MRGIDTACQFILGLMTLKMAGALAATLVCLVEAL